jgi:hypothetical protein
MQHCIVYSCSASLAVCHVREAKKVDMSAPCFEAVYLSKPNTCVLQKVNKNTCFLQKVNKGLDWLQQSVDLKYQVSMRCRLGISV